MLLLWGKYVRKYYLRYLIFFILGVAALITVDYFQLEVPEILGQIVDKLQSQGSIDVSGEWFTSLISRVVVIAVILFAGRVIWRLSLFYASKKMEEKIRLAMYEKAEKLDIFYYQDNKVGNVMNWFTNDLETLEEFLGWGSLMMIDGVFLTVIALVKMFILNTALALIALVPILLIAVWGALCEKYMGIKWTARQESNDDLYDYSQESFTGIRVIKAFVKETQQIHAFSKMALKNADINVEFTKISVIFDVIIEVIIAAVAATILGFGGWFAYGCINGAPIYIAGKPILIKTGELITFTGYFFHLVWPMIALGQVVTMLSKARSSYRRIANFLDTPETLIDEENGLEIQAKGDIEFKDFSFTFPNQKSPSIKHITLKINQGENVGIVGAVGCGKSTLVNTLVRLYNVEKNKIFIDGIDIMKIKIQSVRNNVAITPQDNFLFSDSIFNNIAFSNIDSSMDKVKKAAQFASVDEDIEQFSNKYDSVMGENGHTVSGGQKQRISIARAYVKNAPILILDDSVSAVDMKTEKSILNSIKEERKSKTTLVVASRISTVMDMDKIVILKDGELEAFDTPVNLLKTNKTFIRMHSLQQLEEEMAK